MDDVREYGKDPGELAVQVIAFETDYVTRNVDGAERQVPRDKVILGKIGDAQYRQEMWISRLEGERCDDPLLWEAIKPQYEAWKRGEEIIEAGTPLSATSFVPPKAVAAYRHLNIRTVETLAKVEDGDLAKLPLDARKHRDMARKYLEVTNSETAKLAERAKAQDDVIAELRARLAELENAKPARKAA